MEIEITLQAKFWLRLSAWDVGLLMKMAEHHYDGACKAAGRSGGFLFGWRNTVWAVASEGIGTALCDANRRELDTMLKICEGTRMAVRAQLLTAEDATRLDALCALVLTALEQATVVCNVPALSVRAPTPRGQLLWATSPGRW